MVNGRVGNSLPWVGLDWQRLAMSGKAVRIGAIALAIGAAGCAQSTVAPEETVEEPVSGDVTDLPLVVATTSVVCDLTQQVAGETVDLVCLLEPGQDPHTYEPTPSDRTAIEDADAILSDGYNFSPDIAQLLEATSNPATQVAVFEVAVPEPLMGAGHDHDHDHGEEAAHDHDHGEEATHEHDHHDHGEEATHDHDHAEEEVATTDHAHDHEEEAAHDHSSDHGGDVADGEMVPDPHIWHDATNGVAMLNVVQESLAAIAPDHADMYAENAEAIANQLTEIDAWIQVQVATVPEGSRKLVTTHDSFRYFANAYDFEVAGALSGLSTDQELPAGRLTDLVDQVREADVPAIFAETTTNTRSIETVARDAGVTVPEQPLFVEGPGESGAAAETYQEMLVVNTCTIVEGLGGSCAIADAPL
ncbi:metal ABC transporter solute-binding protein, Zn/Mn family [Vacuolonema iberomarrocanum]|uniref:metal ABC transporter solute-binding protein, Zn/Mn family n=1 Tax=Vacuolonema iberomarrocanum TaxID=3454632 RepID=UPI003F6DC8F8